MDRCGYGSVSNALASSSGEGGGGGGGSAGSSSGGRLRRSDVRRGESNFPSFVFRVEVFRDYRKKKTQNSFSLFIPQAASSRPSARLTPRTTSTA